MKIEIENAELFGQPARLLTVQMGTQIEVKLVKGALPVGVFNEETAPEEVLEAVLAWKLQPASR